MYLRNHSNVLSFNLPNSTTIRLMLTPLHRIVYDHPPTYTSNNNIIIRKLSVITPNTPHRSILDSTRNVIRIAYVHSRDVLEYIFKTLCHLIAVQNVTMRTIAIFRRLSNTSMYTLFDGNRRKWTDLYHFDIFIV
jgi:hypothetical protein